MIVHLPANLSQDIVNELAKLTKAIVIKKPEYYVFVTSSSVKELPQVLAPFAINEWIMKSDMQLSSRDYFNGVRKINIGDTYIGGDCKNTLMIAGPCSIEDEEQIDTICQMLVKLGVKVLRAGCFKPRTSPYTFRGLGIDGLKLLDKMRKKYGVKMNKSDISQYVSARCYPCRCRNSIRRYRSNRSQKYVRP